MLLTLRRRYEVGVQCRGRVSSVGSVNSVLSTESNPYSERSEVPFSSRFCDESPFDRCILARPIYLAATLPTMPPYLHPRIDFGLINVGL